MQKASCFMMFVLMCSLTIIGVATNLRISCVVCYNPMFISPLPLRQRNNQSKIWGMQLVTSLMMTYLQSHHKILWNISLIRVIISHFRIKSNFCRPTGYLGEKGGSVSYYIDFDNCFGRKITACYSL